jgi:hypothetical protein
MFILSAALLSINCDQCEPMERAIATSPDDAFSAVERLYDCGGGHRRGEHFSLGPAVTLGKAGLFRGRCAGPSW